jgi:serine O-acetyltransferase
LFAERNVIASWNDFRSYVRADFASRGDTRLLRAFVVDPVARFTVLLRLQEYLINSGQPALLRIPFLVWFRRLSVRLGFSVGPNIFGPGLAIVHYGLLVLDPTTRIGRNCRIHMGVHIGGAAKFVAKEEMHLHSPKIGDNAYIGPGAKLYGPVHLGNNCTIGANAVVTRSIEGDGLTLAGVPARVIAEGGEGERVLKGAAT